MYIYTYDLPIVCKYNVQVVCALAGCMHIM